MVGAELGTTREKCAPLLMGPRGEGFGRVLRKSGNFFYTTVGAVLSFRGPEKFRVVPFHASRNSELSRFMRLPGEFTGVCGKDPQSQTIGGVQNRPWRLRGFHPASCKDAMDRALPNMRRTLGGLRQSHSYPLIAFIKKTSNGTGSPC
jgi:hypothetical protein